jgi:mono/diheme cytochrome c family protein
MFRVQGLRLRNFFTWLSIVGWAALPIGLGSCSNAKTENGSSTKFEQYYVQGEQLYLTHCSNCHQKNGTGLGLVYPPLNKSDYMDNNFNDVLCLIKNGKQGELIVNGKSFVQPMPGIPSLTDLEVAEIATYIYNSWEHNRGLVDVKEVTPILNSCKSSETSE